MTALATRIHPPIAGAARMRRGAPVLAAALVAVPMRDAPPRAALVVLLPLVLLAALLPHTPVRCAPPSRSRPAPCCSAPAR
jgi:hypothetical protein